MTAGLSLIAINRQPVAVDNHDLTLALAGVELAPVCSCPKEMGCRVRRIPEQPRRGHSGYRLADRKHQLSHQGVYKRVLPSTLPASVNGMAIETVVICI